MFERFTDEARAGVVRAQELARARRDDAVRSEYLLLALAQADGSVARRVLDAMGLDAADIEASLRPVPADVEVPTGFMPFSPDAKLALEQSLRRALEMGDAFIGTEHVLLGLLSRDDFTACRILSAQGVTMAGALGAVSTARELGHEAAVSTDAPGRRRPDLTDMRRPAVGLVTCSFCGGAVPEVGRVVRGRAGGVICETCGRAAAELLAEDAPEAQDPALRVESPD